MTSSVPVTTSGGGGGGGGSRWCPTPEQVMLLEGMYRGGLKTPTATQIQQITARLSIYGKIQGKNVFYWFQNHKARDRQKLRKKLMALYHQHRLYPLSIPPTHHPQDHHHHHQFLHHHQVGVEADGGATKCKTMNNMSWKVDLPSTNHHETCKVMCDCPLITMMMMDNNNHNHDGTTPPYCTRVPPKTLQLFPLNSTATATDDDVDLKQQDHHSSKP